MENEKNDNKSNEDYLKQYLNDTSAGSTNNMKFNFNEPTKEDKSTKTGDLQYFAFDAKITPLGKFYPNGTRILVRPATVKEIQIYSTVDDNNPYDIIEKMNDMIASCVRIKYNDDTVSSYLNTKDGDRFYLIFLIHELTFQTGTRLVANAVCDCGKETSIEIKRDNFVFHENDDMMDKYFDDYKKKFVFDLQNGDNFEVGIPTVGLQKSFTDFIIREFKEKKATPNMSFLKVIPFLVSSQLTITDAEIKEKLSNFQNMNDDSFQFINDAVGRLKFGIKEVKKTCDCGLEVHSDDIFPSGASGIFVVSGAFERFIKK